MLDRRFLPSQRYPLTMKKGGKSFMILSPKWQQTYEEALQAMKDTTYSQYSLRMYLLTIIQRNC